MGEYQNWHLVVSGFATEARGIVLGWQSSSFYPMKRNFGAQAGEDLFGQRGDVQVSRHEGQIVMVIGCPEGQAGGRKLEVIWDFNGPLADSGSFHVDTCDVIGFDWVL